MADESEVRHERGETRARLQAVVAAVLVLAFLKWSQPATMPLAFATFLIALAWPLQERLEHKLPRWAAFTCTVLTLLLALSVFVGALVWSIRIVAERAPQYAGRMQEVQGRLEAWARGWGLSLPQGSEALASGDLARAALAGISSSVSLILLVIALAFLGLFEVHAFRRRAEAAFRHERYGRELIQSAREIASKFQQYFRALAVTALLQGVTVYLLSLALGLDFAFVWAVIACLLNFIPTVGSVLAVIPPTLFALVQFDGFGRPLAVFLGMSALQLVMGNYVDPLISGKMVSLSPVIVLASIVFWGWIWGVPGAFLGVPITVGLLIAADHHPKTRWIAHLLAPRGDNSVSS